MANFKASTLRKILAGSLAVLMLTSSYAALPLLPDSSIASITVNAEGDTTAVVFEDSGLKYTVLSDTDTPQVEVTCAVKDEEGNFPSEINVPAEVTYEGTTYAVTSLGENAFSKTTYTALAPTSITLPDGLLKVGKYAFRASAIPSINIPSTVKELGYGAFYLCTSENVTLHEGIETLGDFCFRECTASSITIPSTVSELPLQTFYKFDGEIILSEGITKVGNYCFSNSSAPSITLPSTVQELGEYAFSYCKSPAVTLNQGITTIGKYCFQGCTAASITVPSTVTELPDYAFYNCKATSLKLPEGLTKIGKSCFYGCTASEIILPAGVHNLPGAAFEKCTAEKIEIKGDITSMGTSVFSQIEAKTVDFDGSICDINQNVFHSAKIESLKIPEGCSAIEYNAFKYCTELQSIEFPSTLRFIDNDYSTSTPSKAFEGCDKLIETENGGVYAGAALLRIDDATLPEDGVLHIRNGTTVIAEIALKSTKVKDIIFPSSYTALSFAAVGSMSMEKLTIPSTVAIKGATSTYRSPLYTGNTDISGSSLKPVGKNR